MTEEDDNTVGGDQIHAEHAQGPIGQASGAVSQHFGEQTNITTGGGDQAGRDIDKRQGEVFVEHSMVYGDVVGQQHNYYQPPTTPLDRREQRNRRAMLDKVEHFWIKSVLEQSLYQIARLELGLEHDPEKVSHPWETVLQCDTTNRAVPAGTPIIKLFDDLDGKLLILGAPGSGKTTLLLELARDLITRARSDPQHPIPLVFNLSTWASKRRPLKEWLVGELNERYDVPRKLAQQWVEADAILPLLDGLDEVAPEQRDACSEAINTYRRERGLVPLAVCSRMADYEALTSKLQLYGAVAIQPLTHQTVDAYLRQGGRLLAGVRATLRDDPLLWELMDSPLLLSVMTLTYKDTTPTKLRTMGALEERRRQLFDDYIVAMFTRRGLSKGTTIYPQAQTQRQLSWLAGEMVERNETVFYIERMQPA